MPKVLEVLCANDDCVLDMFSLHYAESPSGDVDVTEYSCPVCGQGETLQTIEIEA